MANYTQADDLTNLILNKDDIITLNYTGVYKELILPLGRYKIECYGAQGGLYSSRGGYGGYSKGIITFKQQQSLYAYVGGQGQRFNSTTTTIGTPGGGASDIRLIQGMWNELESLKSRIIVAAGGGGGAYGGGTSANTANAGYSAGGGINAPISTWNKDGKGAQQTSGGAGGYGGYWGSGGAGLFGVGNCGPYQSDIRGSNAGVGGGGYYGGGGGSAGEGVDGNGGGGSSFISGLEGCNAIDKNGNHTGQPIHYSGLFFTDCNTISDTNDGNGKILITYLGASYYYVSRKDFNIDEITLNDFIRYGHTQQEMSSDDLESFLFASQIINIPTKVIPHNQIMINSNFIDISHIENIWKITITGQTSINSDAKFLINNRNGWFTYKDSQWYQLTNPTSRSSISPELIKNSGMTMLEISLIPTEAWTELFPEKEKFISFMALMISEDFDTTPIISSINVNYDSTIYGKHKIHDTLYSVRNKVDKYEVTWNTTDKRKIEVIPYN